MLDFYGTFRGKCKECSCIEYVTENNSIKCAYCDHSPSKHEIKPENFETNLNSEVITEPVITDLSNIDKVSLIGNLSLELQCKHKVPRIAVDKVISTFEHIMNEKLPEINSDFKRKSFLNKNSILLRPTLIRIEDTKCYVVSVIEIIKIFLQHPYLQQYLNLPVSSNYTNCVKKDIVDGSNFSVLSVTLDLQFSVHDDGDRAATPGKQTMKEILFSKFKLPTFSSQVMPYLNGDDLGGTERKTIFNLLVNEIIYYLDNENLLMSSNRNVQGIGYSQLQNKLLETYPKMLKEPHNLQRKHRSKGPLSVLTTTISDRRRKRREMLRRSNYNFDLSKEEILEILKLVQEVELIMKKNISDMCECLKTLCRKD
ncbi:hypothetical protein Avbf_17047 [Armadillidium vulgare]|nr:hypothetical protein Avbf_17047 [Armadillidium vulgare]